MLNHVFRDCSISPETINVPGVDIIQTWTASIAWGLEFYLLNDVRINQERARTKVFDFQRKLKKSGFMGADADRILRDRYLTESIHLTESIQAATFAYPMAVGDEFEAKKYQQVRL